MKRDLCPHCKRPMPLTRDDVRDIYVHNEPISVIAKKIGRTKQLVSRIKNKSFHPEWVEDLVVNSGLFK